MEEKDFLKKMYFVLLGIGIVILGTVFKLLASVILPVLFSVFLGFVLLPLVQKMNKKAHIPWITGSIVVTILSIGLILVLSTLLFQSLSSIISQYPKYENRFTTVYKLIAESLSLEFDESKSFLQNVWNVSQIRNFVQKFAVSFSSFLMTFGKNLIMIFLFEAFFLIELRHTQGKINDAFQGAAKGKFLRISENIVTEIIHFLSIKFFISLTTGIIVWLGVKIIGMDFPVLWGFLAFLMNFIPTFGSIISTILTSLFALMQFFPVYWKIIYVFLLMLTVNMVLGNIVEPRIEGRGLGLSPFVILVSLTIWGYIWGFMGMLLAVPMMVIIKIVCENISYLQPFAVFIGNGSVSKKKSTVTNKHWKNKESVVADFFDSNDLSEPSEPID